MVYPDTHGKLQFVSTVLDGGRSIKVSTVISFSHLKSQKRKYENQPIFLFSIANLQTKVGKGLKLPFTHFRFNIVK